MESRAWEDVARPILAAVEAARPKHGPKPSYETEELEGAVLYWTLGSESTYEKARGKLAGDRSRRCREALSFDAPRRRVGRNLSVRVSRDGVPSEATIWRHMNRIGLDRYVAMYRQLFERIVDDHFREFPAEMAAESLFVGWDGSVIRSHFTSFERRNRETGEVRPPTLSGGGFRPRTKDNGGKDGHGFNMVAAVSQTGCPLVARFGPINQPEGGTARAMLEDEWARIVAPYLKQNPAGVMAFDAAYSGGHVRAAVHASGYVPNCHSVSHADRPRSTSNAELKDRDRYAIEGKPNWELNGHFELICRCGKGRPKKETARLKRGVATARLSGWCKDCGNVSLTAGEWRIARNYRSKTSKATKRVVRCMPGDEPDWRIGNPLTFNDALSKSYGQKRFGRGEGFHGSLVNRFGLLKEKSWYSDIRQAERDFLRVFFMMHALAMEQRRRASGTAPWLTSAGPPPQSLAA
jgi:hypothetical protein